MDSDVLAREQSRRCICVDAAERACHVMYVLISAGGGGLYSVDHTLSCNPALTSQIDDCATSARRGII